MTTILATPGIQHPYSRVNTCWAPEVEQTYKYYWVRHVTRLLRRVGNDSEVSSLNCSGVRKTGRWHSILPCSRFLVVWIQSGSQNIGTKIRRTLWAELEISGIVRTSNTLASKFQAAAITVEVFSTILCLKSLVIAFCGFSLALHAMRIVLSGETPLCSCAWIIWLRALKRLSAHHSTVLQWQN